MNTHVISSVFMSSPICVLAHCGGMLSEVTGQFGIFDVDLDGLYEENLDCRWYISGTNHRAFVQLSIVIMDIEFWDICHDKLQVTF